MAPLRAPHLLILVSGLASALIVWNSAIAQDAPVIPPPPAADDPGDVPADVEPEALTRGPVHEAFAEQYNTDPEAGLTIPKQPPEDIDELPPDTMPEGNNVEWIPGYWGWDDDREDFIWISGLWRDIPPGQRWVPGYWTETSGGFQWTSGFWMSESTAELDYLPQPPASLDQGPNVESPGENYFWVPGSWSYSGAYRWRPGYWAPVYDEWVWVPDRYSWTPFGYVFCPGYWDYRLPNRGVLFAPVYSVHWNRWRARHRFFTPGFALDVGPLALHLFVRPSYRHYYFGDYYDDGYYSRWGMIPWYDCHYGGRFRRHRYDPLLVFYSHYHRRHHRINYRNRLSRWHRYFRDHRDHRPPRTVRALAEFEDRHRHDDRGRQVVKNVRLGRKLDEFVAEERKKDDRHFVRLDEDDRKNRKQVSRRIKDLTNLRRNQESDKAVVVGPDAGDSGKRSNSGKRDRQDGEGKSRDGDKNRDNKSKRKSIQLPKVADDESGRGRRARVKLPAAPGADSDNSGNNRSSRTDRGTRNNRDPQAGNNPNPVDDNGQGKNDSDRGKNDGDRGKNDGDRGKNDGKSSNRRKVQRGSPQPTPTPAPDSSRSKRDRSSERSRSKSSEQGANGKQKSDRSGSQSTDRSAGSNRKSGGNQPKSTNRGSSNNRSSDSKAPRTQSNKRSSQPKSTNRGSSSRSSNRGSNSGSSKSSRGKSSRSKSSSGKKGGSRRKKK